MENVSSVEKDSCILRIIQSRIDEYNFILTYEFINNCKSDVYIFNRLHHGLNNDGIYQTNKNLVNVIIENDNTFISKRIVKVPSNLEVEKPNIPCLTLVNPNSSFKETLKLSLPLRPWTPYSIEVSNDGKIFELPPIFEIGYFISSGHSKSLLKNVNTLDGEAVFIDLEFKNQRIIAIPLSQIKLPIRVANCFGFYLNQKQNREINTITHNNNDNTIV